MSIVIKSVNMTYPDFAKMKPSIALDSSFNVGSTEKGRWKKQDMVRYIESILYGMAVQNIIIVDLQKCFDASVEGSDDAKYFKKWLDAGFKYIAVDGNNRSITIERFYKDETICLNTNRKYTIESGDGRTSTYTLTNDNSYFSSLPTELYTKLADSEITVKIVEKATRAEISDLFVNVNSGIALNRQEKRNAILSEVANVVRTIGFSYDGSVGKQILKDDDIIRFGFHEAVASALVYYTNQDHPITIDSNAIDRAYGDNSYESRNLPAFQKTIKSVYEPIVNDVRGLFHKNKFKKFNLMNWTILNFSLNKLNIKIKDQQQFIEWFVGAETKRNMDVRHYYVNRKNNLETWREMSRDDANILQARRVELEKSVFESDLFDKEVLVQLDGKRIFDSTQRYHAWVRQDQKCPLTGKPIPQTEIFDTSKWAADHIHEYSKGGKTTVDNLQLVCYEAHKIKTKEFMKNVK